MISGLGQFSPQYVRCDRPQRSAATPPAGSPDSVEPFSAPPQETSRPGLVKTALAATADACKAALFGPVAHYAGKVVAALGKTPKYREPKILPSELGPLPASKIDRPVVFVAGWHTHNERFGPIGAKLTENGANGGVYGYVKGGVVYSDGQCNQVLTNPPADMKVFVSILESNRTDPGAAQPELKKNLDTIRRLTGQPKQDVVAFSMGGLQTRVWLDEHAEAGMGKVLFLATPHQGAGLAGLSHHLLEGKQRGWDTDWLLCVKDVTPEDKGAVQWLRPDSEQRQDLNTRWDVQKSRVEEVLCLGSASKRTLSANMWPGPGDGMVPAHSLELEGLPVEIVDDQCTHGQLIQSPKVYTRMRDYFGWGS